MTHERIERVSVWWPASGVRTVYTDVPLDAFIKITEGAPDFERLSHETIRFELGGH